MATEPKKYETLYLIRPDIPPEDILKIQNKVEQSVTANGGTIIKSEKWAERDLAYRINNHSKGIYYIALYEAEAGAVKDIERYFTLSKNNVLRFMTVLATEEEKSSQAVTTPSQGEANSESPFQTPPTTAEETQGGSEL